MVEKQRERKTSFLSKPFDLNRNGRIDPAEVALIMMIIDDVNDEDLNLNVSNNIIDIDDLDINGI